MTTISYESVVEITASRPRPSTYVPTHGAVDVDVEVKLSSSTVTGEVTLVVDRHNNGRLCAYAGQPDHWVSGPLLRALRHLTDSDYRDALTAIEAAAVEAAR